MQYGLMRPTNEISLRPLRPRQEKAIAAIREAIREGHKRIVVQAPPGFGKTLLAAHIIAGAIQKKRKPLFTCPAISLIDQTLSSFEAEGINDIGIMQADHVRTDWEAQVQIASIQTLLRREHRGYGLIIPDECHEVYDGFNALLASPEWAETVVIGLSATPWSRGLGLHYSKLIIAATFRDMMEDGLAREYPIFAPEHNIDRTSIPVLKGEFTERGAAAAMSDKTIVGDVLKEWKERSTREKTFAFCVTRAHAKVQMEAFLDAGIPFGYIDSNTPQGDKTNPEKGTRAYIFRQMQYGEIAGIASVGCLIRGIDEKVYNILDLAPTKSEIRHVQKWGRMRTGDPNATYVGFDHAGNNSEDGLGLFWDIHHDSLDTRKPGERKEAYEDEAKPAKPRTCPKCRTLVPAGARACPTCSETMPMRTGVTVLDGRLVELGSPKGEPKAKKAPKDEKQVFYSGFLHIGHERNPSDPDKAKRFALANYHERFGCWPRGLVEGPSRPTPAVRKYLHEKRMAFLASKAVAPQEERVNA